MAQPIKNNIDFEKLFSSEITNLIGNIRNDFLNEYPMNEITPEVFVAYALSYTDSMLYKVVNSFINSYQIEQIYDSLILYIQSQCVSLLRPGRKIDYSAKLKNAFSDSVSVKNNMNHSLITSDHVLLAILSGNLMGKEVSGKFNNLSVNYDQLENNSYKLHKTFDEISQISISNDGIADSIVENVSQKHEEKKARKLSSQYLTCLNDLSSKIDPLIGREKEVNNIINVFARKNCNNVVIVGKSGAGKTAIVNGVAKLIDEGRCHISLKNKAIYQLDMPKLIAGTNLRGAFEEKIIKVFEDIKNNKNVIVFIDNIHVFINDRKKDEYDIIGTIDKYISSDNIRIIIATTIEGYKSICHSSPSIKRKFQRVDIDQMSVNDTLEILKRNKSIYEKYHNVIYNDDILSYITKLSDRYITDTCLPNSAISMLDEIGAMKKLQLMEPDEVKELNNDIIRTEVEKKIAISRDDFNAVEECKERINRLKAALYSITTDGDNITSEMKTINTDDVNTCFSNHTNIPITSINASERTILSGMEQLLNREVIGQQEAIKSIVQAFKRNKAGLRRKDKPIFSGMLVGNTATGKTKTAKVIAREMFGNEKYLVRFDMSEYADKTSINKLIGSGYGYVGSDKGGLLTEAVKNNKYCVLLIDELEKANEEIFNIFLQVLDEGFLTDNMGEKVDFKNTVILFTTNVGAKKANNERRIGITVDRSENKKEIIEKELKNFFPPEFINRFDDVIYYKDFSDDSLKEIIRLELGNLIKKVNEIECEFTFDDSVVDYIFNIVNKEREYGARPILRAIQNEIEDKIADKIINEDARIFNARVIDYKIEI